MSRASSVCQQLEPDLAAVAAGESEARTAERVEAHLRVCRPCRDDFEGYRAVEHALAGLRGGSRGAEEGSRLAVERCLARVRERVLFYRVFDSPLGRLLIGRTEEGVSLVEYLDDGEDLARALRGSGLEPVEDGADLERLYRDVLDYLKGGRTRLEWRLDLRLARSDFHRRVLQATAGIPYGAVTSYAQIAREIGVPAGVRAVAQALRWNPLPIVVPCHRVIGSSGALTGYAGSKLALKQRLLAVEHVPTRRAGRDFRVARDAMYVRDPGHSEYCLPTCGAAPSMSLARLMLFASRQQAEACGLTPCRDCRPDLHPLAS